MDKIAAGTIAVVLDNTRQQILLHLRRDHNRWGLPGGSCDFGESFAEAVVREVAEETGLQVAIVRPFGAFSNPGHFIFRYPDGNQVHGFMIGFECKVVGGELDRSNSESCDVRWFALDEIPADLFSNHLTVMSAFKSGATFTLD